MDRRKFLAKSTVAAAGVLGGSVVTRASARGRPRESVILTGALVYDGSGARPAVMDVAVEGDRISAVAPSLPGSPRMDLSGFALAPGFIDIHSHTDLSLLVNPRAESKIRQGVTTEVTGQDGGSIGPWTDSQFEQTRDDYRGRYDVEIDFRDLRGFFRRLERQPGSVNVASMVGAGTIRGNVIGNTDRPATDVELERMVGLVVEAISAGACGLSSGLEYIPGAFASSDELVALAGALRGRGRGRGTGLPYASHMRNEDDRLFAAIEEALHVGRLADVPVQISHLKAQGQRNWWKAETALEMITRARDDGVDATLDRYPYVAYSTGLGSLFPVWAREGGTDAFLARLDDADLTDRIERAVREKVAQLGSWDAVQVTSTSSDELSWARGKRLGELATGRAEEPYALLLRLIREDRNGSGMVGFGMSEENTSRIMAHPLGMICSDAGARAPYGALASGTPHPRTYGAFPRFLGHYCRDQRLLPLETAIQKITAMPADKLRMQGRGRITPGAFADLVAFDPDRVADRATFEEPHQYPVGIPHVMVNGQWVIRDEEHTGALPGVVVKPG